MSEGDTPIEDAALKKGQVVYWPGPDELFVDIDCEADLAILRDCLDKMGALVLSHAVTPSPSRLPGHHHVRVKLSRPVRDGYERCLLQLLLGSDRLRELLGWKRLERGEGDRAFGFLELPDFGMIPASEATVTEF